MTPTPNIFKIAGRVYSQNVFVPWLIQHADEKYRMADELLCMCGKHFITELLRKRFKEFDEPIVSVMTGTQWDGIDIWTEVNHKYLIIIESKSCYPLYFTQLLQFKQMAHRWCMYNHFKPPVCIYLLAGKESVKNLGAIRNQGFMLYSRSDFISFLASFNNIRNNIFRDFQDYLLNDDFIDQQILPDTEGKNKKIDDWKTGDWHNFFQLLMSEMEIISRVYENKPGGGSWHAVLFWDYWREYAVYLQIEQDNLCFKISIDPDEIDLPSWMVNPEVFNELHLLLLTRAREAGLHAIGIPSRFDLGNHITVAVVRKKDWLGEGDKPADIRNVATVLKGYISFLKSVIYE